MLSVNTRRIIQTEIHEKYHLLPFSGLKKINLYDGNIEREIHGVLHASDVAAFVIVLVDMLCEIGCLEALSLSMQDIVYLQLTAFHHDCARKGEGIDIWESESQANCQAFLENIGASPNIALYFSRLIVEKETESKDPRENILRIIFQSVDCLDALRCKVRFLIDKMRVWKLFHSCHQEQMLFDLALDVAKMLGDQGNLLYEAVEIAIEEGVRIVQIKSPDGQRVLQEKRSVAHKIISAHKASADPEIKKTYEHSEDCYSKVVTNFGRYPMLKKHYQSDKDPLVTQSMDYRETPIQRTRRSYRERATRREVSEAFIFKALRGDNENFYLSFLDGILPPYEHKTIRHGTKKIYTVNGLGSMRRADKKPQYTAEEKAHFSKAQPTSLGLPDLFPPAFNFNNEQTKSTGLLLLNLNRNTLLTHHLYTEDFGSASRLNDFNCLEEADSYFKKHKGKTLFSLDELDTFIQKMKENKKEDQAYPELLARLRWTNDKNCYLTTNMDTLESRLLAQASAKILYRRSQVLGRDPSYYVPILYYLPNNPALHLLEYSDDEQKLDKIDALYIASDVKLRTQKYQTEDFEFLLALLPSQLRVVLQDRVHRVPLVVWMLSHGYLHIFDFLIELGILNKNDFMQCIQEKMTETKSAKPLMEALCYAIDRDRNDIADIMIDALPTRRDYLLQINQRLFNYELTLLQYAFYKKNIRVAHRLSLLPGMNFQEVTEKGANLLHLSAAWGTMDGVRFAIDNAFDINQPDKKGNTPLFYACARGQADVARALLSTKGILIGPNANGRTVVQLAALNGQAEVLEVLFQDGRFSFTQTEDNLLDCASHSQSALKFLLTIPNIDVNQPDGNGHYPIHNASRKGFAHIVAALIARGARINQTDYFNCTAVAMAAANRHVDVVKILVEAGCVINKISPDPLNEDEDTTESPLEIAILGGQMRMVDILVAAGAILDSHEMVTSLFFAARGDHVDMVKRFLHEDMMNNGIEKLTTLLGKKLLSFFEDLYKEITNKELQALFEPYMSQIRSDQRNRNNLDETSAEGLLNFGIFQGSIDSSESTLALSSQNTLH